MHARLASRVYSCFDTRRGSLESARRKITILGVILMSYEAREIRRVGDVETTQHDDNTRRPRYRHSSSSLLRGVVQPVDRPRRGGPPRRRLLHLLLEKRATSRQLAVHGVRGRPSGRRLGRRRRGRGRYLLPLLIILLLRALLLLLLLEPSLRRVRERRGAFLPGLRRRRRRFKRRFRRRPRGRRRLAPRPLRR